MNMEAKSLKIYDISDVSPAETKGGDDSAQRRLAEAFEFGPLGLEIDVHVALDWYRKAA